MVAFKGPNVILGLCKCNYSLTVKRELLTPAREKQGADWIKQGGGTDSALVFATCALKARESGLENELTRGSWHGAIYFIKKPLLSWLQSPVSI